MKELKAKQKVSGHSPSEVERDIELREVRDFGNSVIQQLGSKAAKQPEMMSTLQLLFSQAGLPPPPSPTASRTGSALSSARSSTSQFSALSSARYAVYLVDYSNTFYLQCCYCFLQELHLPCFSHTHHTKGHYSWKCRSKYIRLQHPTARYVQRGYHFNSITIKHKSTWNKAVFFLIIILFKISLFIGMSPRSSTSSLGGGVTGRGSRTASKPSSLASSRHSSRPSSNVSSRHSSRASSRSGQQPKQRGSTKKSDLDLTIGPS